MTAPAREEGLAPAVARWLVGTDGRETIAAVTAGLDSGEEILTVATRLRADGLEPANARAATAAAVTRRSARAVHTEAEQIILTPSGFEQASRQRVAAWRAQRFADAGAVLDLCCGLGVDALELAGVATHVVALDHDRARLVLLCHNADVMDAAVSVVAGDAIRPPVVDVEATHADPSRRAGGRRLRRLRDLHPPVPDLLGRLRRAQRACLVLSPGVNLEDPDLPPDAELEFIQDGDDLVEAAAWLGDARSPQMSRRATLLPGGVTRAGDGRSPMLAVGPVGPWLLEVAPAAVRARLHDEIGREIGARRLARRRALLTCDTEPPPSPWWTRWRVAEVLPLRVGMLRGWLDTIHDEPIEIASHGLERDPERLWAQLGRPPRGPHGLTLHLVRTDDSALVVAARRVVEAEPIN